MIVDARTLSHQQTLQADICIVGAGAAGIALARELIGTRMQVLLLEGGGLKFEHRSQSFYRGEVIGRKFTPLEFTRRRQFGGSTATWFGRCHPLDESDFEGRAWFPHSGWAIPFSELKPFYERANPLFEFGNPSYDESTWNEREGWGGFQNSSLESKIFHFSPPAKFGETYRAELERAQNIKVFLHTNALHIQLNQDSNAVESIRCATLQKKIFHVRAKIFILALGGLETPRLLLASRDVQVNGVGNQHDLVGRYFMDHISLFDGFVTDIPARLPKSFFKLDYSADMRRLGMVRAIGLTESQRRENKLLNACAFFVKRPAHKLNDLYFSKEMQAVIAVSDILHHAAPPALASFKNMMRLIRNSPTLLPLLTNKPKGFFYGLQIQLECAPNPASRVTLSDQRDALGLPRLQLDWKLTQQDLESYLRLRLVLRDGLEQAGFKTHLINHDLDSEGFPVSIVPMKHHSGTTRMSNAERHGVVNEHCRVHGVDNLYIAGSSVFPTAGMANPTLTIVALAIRLADHIKRGLTSGG